MDIDIAIENWFKKDCVFRVDNSRGKGLVICGDRNTCKSTFISQFVGHTAGAHNFDDNPYIIYV